MTAPDPQAGADQPPATPDGGAADIVAGAIFGALAAAFAVEGLSYDIGTLVRMGPGFMPLLLAAILAAIGATVAVGGLLTLSRGPPAEAGPVPWRAFVTIVAAIVLFGAFAPRAGLVPIVFVCALLSALASRRGGVLEAVLVAAALSAVCWLVFKVGLGVSLPTFGPLFVG